MDATSDALLYVSPSITLRISRMSCVSQPILCERLSSVGVGPPLGKCKKAEQQGDGASAKEAPRPLMLFLKRASLKEPEWTAHGG